MNYHQVTDSDWTVIDPNSINLTLITSRGIVPAHNLLDLILTLD